MPGRFFKLLFLLSLFFISQNAIAQHDIDFHLSNTFLSGKNIIKVKRDYSDPYLWVLTQNNEVYRINSETLAVDNYTPKFAAYSNLNFIDIAGYSKDEVFIAAPDQLLRFTNGAITSITSANGLNGQIKQIGFDYRSMQLFDFFGVDGPRLFVSTNTTIDYYLINSNQFRPANEFDFGQNGKYELRFANYKKAMLAWTTKDIGQFWDEDLYHVYDLTPLTIYGGYIYLGTPQFGNQLKGATYYTGDQPYSSSNFSIYGDQFWTTEKGLFQNKWSNSNNPNSYGSKHYLDNISINQISSIYGLASLGFTNTRENLLVATDEGLYVSNSKLYPQDILPQYDFYKYAGLGSKKINYIDVNAIPLHADINTPFNLLYDYCENGLWVGAVDGLYLLKPDYTQHFDQNQAVQAILFEGKGFDITTLDLCPGQTAKASIYITTNASVQWYKNGVEIANQSDKSLEINSQGEYYAILYDPCSGLHVQTNRLTVNYLNGTTVPLNYPDKMNFCFGSTATLSVPNNPDFQYRWYKDGVLNGVTTPQIDITEDGKYKLEVNTCQDVWIPTKEVDVKFIKIPAPVITPDKTIICAGEEATLSASVNFDATGITNWAPYTYRWFKDDVLLPTTTAILKATATGKYKVEVTSCMGNSATSAEVFINVVTLPDPIITSAKDSYCPSEIATVNTNVPLDATYDINWYKDGVLMPANLNKASIAVTQDGDYSLNVTSKLLPNCIKSAPPKRISFVPFPVYSFVYPDVITRCTGDVVNLKVLGSSTYKYRWYKNDVLTGQTTTEINVTEPGRYYAGISVCENSWLSTKVIEVKFIQMPASVSITSDKPAYCIGDNAALSIDVPASADYNINWFIDGVAVSAWANKTSITASANGDYTVKINGSLTNCERASAPKQLTFNPKPQIAIQQIVSTTLCEGQKVDLRVDYTGGSIKWSTGETTAKISVTRSGTYKATYTSPGGCEVDASTDVSFLQGPVLNLFDGAICAFKKENITLTAPPGYTSYSWNDGESTAQTFEVTKPQTVKLTVTDANNCLATQQIQVKNQCPDVHIANAFTPNNDGVNDTWLVTGIEDDPSVTIKVFSRAGSLVYESKGYTNAWNGTYNGKKLSTGVYYYIITTKNSSEILKGSITIMY